MTDRKASKITHNKQGSASNTKITGDSVQKRTAPKQRQPETTVSNKKNLMVEFEKAEAESKLKIKQPPSEPEMMSQISGSSICSSQIVSEQGRNMSMSMKENDYGFQLPRSYILAMTGLQQAIVQRDAENKKVIASYEAQKIAKQRFKVITEEQDLKLRQNLQKISQLQIQNKLLKEQVTEQKRLAEKNRLDMQLQLTKSKEQQKKLLQNSFKLKMAETEEEMLKLKEEIRRQIQRRQKAEKQIQVLKKQAELLAERTVAVAQHVQQQEKIIRQPLASMPLSNLALRDCLSKKIIKHPETEERQRVFSKYSKPEEYPNSASKPIHQRKQTDGSTFSRERSYSCLKTKQNCPQLVSQYRQLMRHQKQLIGLNYQVQLLEKGLAGQGQDKSQLQRNYQRLRRECEQKQMQIRELNAFLNNPLK